jgi:hypothetical protein
MHDDRFDVLVRVLVKSMDPSRFDHVTRLLGRRLRRWQGLRQYRARS